MNQPQGPLSRRLALLRRPPLVCSHQWEGRDGGDLYICRLCSGWVTQLAHIVAWEAEYGPVPPGKELDHLCRQRPCRNPDHVEPVSHTVNIRRGVCCKLSIEKAELIRASTEPSRNLAGRFGVSMGTIQRVRSNQVWRPDPVSLSA